MIPLPYSGRPKQVWSPWGTGFQRRVRRSIWYVGNRWSGRRKGYWAIKFRWGKVVDEQGPFRSCTEACDAVDATLSRGPTLQQLLKQRDALNRLIRRARRV